MLVLQQVLVGLFGQLYCERMFYTRSNVCENHLDLPLIAQKNMFC